MSNIPVDTNNIGYYIYFNSHGCKDLTHIKQLLASLPNILVDHKKKGVYYQQDFYEIVCKKIFNSVKRNDDFYSGHINRKFIANILRTVDALLLVETLDTIDDKIICGFATLTFFPYINLVHTQILGFNADVQGCRECIFGFIKKICEHIGMMHLTFGGLLLEMYSAH